MFRPLDHRKLLETKLHLLFSQRKLLLQFCFLFKKVHTIVKQLKRHTGLLSTIQTIFVTCKTKLDKNLLIVDARNFYEIILIGKHE